MKSASNPFLPLMLSCVVFASSAHAATLYWDTNGTTTGSGNAGGTWDTGTSSNWNSVADGTATPGTFANGDLAIISAGTDGTSGWTINVSGTVQPSGITFEENGSKTIASGLISVASNPTISSAGRSNGDNFNINTQLTGTGNITLAANGDTSDSGGGIGGNLTIGNSSNNFIGNVTITSGVVNFSDNGAFGNTANDIIIQGGGLVATGNRTLPSTRDIVLSGGGDKIFRLYGSATFTIEGAISGSGNVRHTDGGNLILNGANTFTGNIENHRGNLTLGNSAHTGNVSMFQGTLALTAGNTYTGFTHMRGSNLLRLDADHALPDGTAVVLWGGTTFNANGKTDTLGSLTTGSSSDTNVIVSLGSNGNITVTNNNLPAGLTGGYSNATIAGKVTGSGTITYAHASAGNGLWDIMNATNDFNGNWIVNSGRIRFAGDAAIGNTANDITFGGNVVNTMNNGGGSAGMQVANGTSWTHGVDRTFTVTSGKEGTFYVWGATTQTIDGIITGGGNVRKEDGGTLLLNNTGNNYSGETKIIQGTVTLGANEVLPNATLVRIGGGGGTLNMNGKNETILGLSSIQPSDNALLTDGNVNGAGTLTISGSGTYEFGGSYSPNSAGTLVMSGTGTQILSGTGDNAGGFAAVNSGTLILAKASTGSVHAVGASAAVALTVNGGTARLAGTGDDQIYNESVVHITGGTFDLNDRSEAFRGLTGTGGTVVNNGSGTSTLTLGTSGIAGNTYQTSSVLANGSGTLAVTKTGLGTQNLNGANTYSGATTVNQGRLNINGSLASGSAVTVTASGNLGGDGTIHGNVSLAGNLLPGQGGTTDRSLTINGNVTTSAGNVRHTDGGNLILNGANTFTGNIENHRGNLSLGNSAHNGNVSMFQGTLTANAGNTYTGYTHMRGSNILLLNADNALPDGTYIVFWGGTRFNVNGKTDTVGAVTTGSSGDTNVVMDLGTGANLTVTNNNLVAGTFGGYGNATWDGTIIGTGNITYAHATATGGAAQWDVRNAGNTFTGNWTITNGRLRFQPATLADSSLGNVENDLIFNGSIVDTMNNGGGSASMQVTNGQSATHPATRTVTLNTGKEGTFYVWGGTTTIVEGIITGGGNLRKEDGGTLTLNNTGNNYSGDTKIIQGSLTLGANDVLPDATVVRIGGASGTLQLNGKNDTITGLTSVQPSDSTVLTDGNVNGAGNLTVTGSGVYEFGGSYSTGSAGTLIMNGTGTQILSGTRDNAGAFATVNSGTLILAKASSQTVHAIGASNVTGLTINNGGTVQLAGTGSDQIYIETHVTVNGAFDLNGRNEGFRGIAGSGTISNSAAETTSTLTIGQNSVNGNQYAFAGVVQDGAGVAALAKAGIGTLALTGANTYTGFTDVLGGLLSVDGSLGSTEVYVFQDAYLTGNGSIGDNVFLQTGGGLGTQITDWNGAASVGFTDLTITGKITCSTDNKILVNATGLANFSESNKVFPIATASDGVIDFSAANFTVSTVGFPGNGTWSVRVTGNTLELVYTKATGYASWIDTYELAGPDAAFDFDYDNDGVDNGLEFVLGGNPKVANDVILPAVALSGSGASRTATIEYRRSAASAYLNPTLELSDNLQTWNTAVNGENNTSIVITPDFYATGLDKVSVTLPAEGARGFARISVTNP